MQPIPVNTKLKMVNAPAVGEDAQLRRADWLTMFKVNSYANSGEVVKLVYLPGLVGHIIYLAADEVVAVNHLFKAIAGSRIAGYGARTY